MRKTAQTFAHPVNGFLKRIFSVGILYANDIGARRGHNGDRTDRGPLAQLQRSSSKG